MKKVYFGILIIMMVFAGCSNTPQTSSSVPDKNKVPANSGHDGDIAPSLNETPAKSPVETPEEKSDGEGPLSQYSNVQIEYARIWLQLGPNQEIDELNVVHIPAGTPINSNDDSSAPYPEDVIQLAGSRLVDGSITYSGNGDGTINVYNVPLRWDGNYPAGEDFYLDIIKNTKLISVQLGDDDKIIELIKLLNVQS